MKMRRGNWFVWLAPLVTLAATPINAYSDDGIASLLPSSQPNDSQLLSTRNSQNLNNSAANAARNAGRNSISRGNMNQHHGHSAMNGAMIALGAMQIAQGVLGLMAGQTADQMAGADNSNGNNLSDIAAGSTNSSLGSQGANGLGSGANSVSGSNAGASSLGSASTGSIGASKFAADLNSPDAKAALAAIQDQYGYTPAEFVGLLQQGADLKGIFENAPKNPMTPEEAAVALAASKQGQPEGGAGSALALDRSPASTGAPTGVTGPGEDAATAKSGGLRDALARALASGDETGDEVSPEVRDALAAQAAQERARLNSGAKPAEEMDLFDVVHQKYKERENNMRWGAPLRTAESSG